MRLTIKKLVKLILILFFLIFVFFNVIIGRSTVMKIEEPMVPVKVGKFVLGDVYKNLSKEPNRTMNDTNDLDLALPELNRSQILLSILEANGEQRIRNLHLLPDDFQDSNSSVAIVIQIHKRPTYLRHLVESLSRARAIERTLVIFSHDFHSSVLNDIAEAITDFPVLQIFYPYSMQLYPKEFPGEHPNDCPRDINKKRAKLLRCNNADYPDIYGHYREAKYTQTKHHWFWKMNHVFDKLTVMKGFRGMVLQLEEDHLVSPDVLQLLEKMRLYKSRACRDCGILTLGTYDRRPSYRVFGATVELSLWISAKHNLGMAMDRKTWNQIKTCSDKFCNYDDYNWDWSLQAVGLNCIPGRLKVMVLRGPRVFHIGECGVHHKGKVCNPQTKVSQIQQLLRKNRQYLYPKQLALLGISKSPIRQSKPNGGWGDLRDRALCKRFVG